MCPSGGMSERGGHDTAAPAPRRPPLPETRLRNVAARPSCEAQLRNEVTKTRRRLPEEGGCVLGGGGGRCRGRASASEVFGMKAGGARKTCRRVPDRRSKSHRRGRAARGRCREAGNERAFRRVRVWVRALVPRAPVR